MAANFLHGVETIEIDSGPRPVKMVKTAVIGIVGTAAAGAVNTPILVTSERDFAQFGQDIPGSTIPKALNRIYKQKGTVAIVINVLDPATHKTTLAAPETVTVDQDGKFSLGHAAVVGAITLTNSAGSTTYVKDTDYSFDPATGTEVLADLATYAAGALSRKDQENGYWWSPSNTELLGVTGVETPIDAMINDPNSEANLLNEAGIITVFNSYGTGIRLWGNRSAAFPSETHPKNFINVLRTADVIAESLEYYTLQYIDRPLDNALIDAIVESCNAFMRKLKADGAIIDGKVWFDPADNETTELAAGHVTFTYDFMPPTPAERVTYKSIVNIDYLNQLGTKSS